MVQFIGAVLLGALAWQPPCRPPPAALRPVASATLRAASPAHGAVHTISCLADAEASGPLEGAACRGRRPFTSRLRSALSSLRARKTGAFAALATSIVVGGGKPALAARRSYVPPELEQAFRREKFDEERLQSLGVDVDKIITHDFLFSEKRHELSDVQKEIYDYDDQATEADQGRAVELVLFAGASILGGKLALSGAQKAERWMKSRDEIERQREIELTGTYVNPFAGDVDEIIDPFTGEKKKLEKKPQDDDSKDDGGPQSKPPTRPVDADGDDDDSGAAQDPKADGKGKKPGNPKKKDGGDDGQSGIDILKGLI